MIKLRCQILEHEFEFTFRISRSGRDQCKTVLVILEYEQNGKTIQAFGEAVFSEFYGESLETVTSFYNEIIKHKILENLDPFNLQDFENRINFLAQKHSSAKAGIDIALWDLRAKILNLPLYKLLCLDKNLCPKTSYTLGIADIETIKLKTKTAIERGYEILKVKLGSKNDIETIETIRTMAPKAIIRVDANAAWEVNDAIKVLKHIKELDIEFVEEPLKLDSPQRDYEKLFAESPLEIMADESCHTANDLPRIAKYFHSINIKHTKCGGISEALRMIYTAKALKLKIMLGCFSESTISIAAFAHISPLVDYADLDGSLLLKNEAFKAIEFEGSSIKLKDSPGLGYSGL